MDAAKKCTSSTLRVGVVSTANIASKNYIAITKARNCEVVAVSSRTLAKAEAWAAARPDSTIKAYGSHASLLADPDIDAVYVPAPTGVRAGLVIAAAAAGKSVLCEKPMAPTVAEAEKMIAACAAANVVLMDGVMFMHNPRLTAMRTLIDDEASFGTLRRVVSDFAFSGDDEFKAGNIRMDPFLEPLGALGDLGVYNIRLAMYAFDWEVPTAVRAVSHKASEDGVPIEISCTLTFAPTKDGETRTSTFTNSFENAFRQRAAIIGVKQSIELDDFCISGTVSTECFFKHYKTHGFTANDMCVDASGIETVRVPTGEGQEVMMWEAFARLHAARASATGKEDLVWWADKALRTQRVLNALMESQRRDGVSVDV